MPLLLDEFAQWGHTSPSDGYSDQLDLWLSPGETRNGLSELRRWRRPSSSLLVLPARDARHRAPLTTGKAWGSPGFLRVWTRASSRHQCRCPPAHTDHVENLRVCAAEREVSDQAEEKWRGRLSRRWCRLLRYAAPH